MNTNPFSFSEYLKRIPNETLFRAFLKQTTSSRRVLSSSTIQSVVERASAPKAVIRRFEALSSEGRALCSFVYLFGNQGLAIGDARRQREELLESFLVYEARDEAGNRFILGFDEFIGLLQKPIVSVLLERLGTDVIPGTPPVMQPLDCLRDMVALLSLASEGALKRTQNGSFSKTAGISLRRIIHASKMETLDDQSLSRILVEYATERRLLTPVDNSYRSVTGAVAEWLGQPLRERRRNFLQSSLRRLGEWRTGVLLDLLDTAGAQWLSVAGFPQDRRDDARNVLCVLTYCGAAVAHKTDGDLLFSSAPEMTLDESGAPGQVSILPDFSAIISQETSPDDLYWFSRIGRLVSLDKVYKGQVDRGVIFNSLSQGTDPTDLMTSLVRWRAPANIAATVKEWTREFSRVSVTTETILVSSEEAITTQISSFEGLKEYLEPLHAHRIFRIRPGCEQAVRRILITLGFDPRVPEISQPPAPPSAARAKPGELLQRLPITDVAREDRAPEFRQRTGKYSAELKALDFSDTLHVIDYAILMGYRVRFTYAGSPLIKRGDYAVRPVAWRKSKDEPVLEGEALDSGSRKNFIIAKIERIGVEPDEANV